MLASILTTLFFSLSAICGKRTAVLFGSLAGNLWRLMISAAALGLITWTIDRHSFASASFLWFLFSGIIGFGFGDVGLFLAYPRLATRLVMLLNLCLAPVFGALAEWIWLGTRISPAEALAALLILAGVGMALLPSRFAGAQRLSSAGIAFAVIAGFGQGAGAVISRHAEEISQELAIDVSGFSAAFQRVLGGLVIAFLAWLISTKATKRTRTGMPASPSPPLSVRNRNAAFVLLGAALFGPVIGVSCFQWALKETPSALVLSIVATTPIVLIPFTYFLEKDVPGKKSIAGAVIAVAGVIWVCLIRG